MRHVRLHVLLVLAILVCSFRYAYGQNGFGTILGTVRDQSGAAAPEAAITVTNIGTNVSQTVKSGQDGNYTVVNLIPGEYRVRIELQGFDTAVITGLTLLVNRELRADATLRPGAVQTSVEVQASGALIQTDSSTVGKVVENKQIVDLPLVSRNFMQLTTLSPATVTDNSGTLGNEQQTYRTQLSGGAVWVGGGRGASNSYMIDGVENNDPGFQTPAITPPIDAIQEFNLMNKDYSAEFGGSAEQINIAIKSGTNQFHGTAYEFFRNDVLDDRNFFAIRDPISGRSKPQLRYNQFGGTLGGPIEIPHLIHGKNKLFFFGNYEGTRIRDYLSSTGRYPTAAELQGNFSGDPVIYDPLTGLPFVDNQIPGSRIDAKSKQLSSFFAVPNVGPQPGYNTVGYLASPNNIDQYHIRVDAQISDKDSLFARASVSDQNEFSPNLAPLLGTTDSQSGRNAALSYTHSFTPNLVNQARLGFNRPISILAQQGAFGTDIAGSLFTGTDRSPITYGAPLLNLTNYSSAGATGNGPLDYTTNFWSVVENLSYSHSAHTFKAGFEYRRLFFKEVNAYQPRGNISFTGLFTGGPLDPGGDAAADFVLGLPYSAAVNQGNFTGWYHGSGYNFYLQDDWKITPRLTLNWGLRYEYATPLVEEENRVSEFDPGYPGGRLTTPDKAIVEELNSPLIAYNPSRRLVNPDKNNFAPRVGIAFRPFASNRAVIRTGYGVYYDTFEYNEYVFPVLNPPFQNTSSLFATKTNPIDLDTLFPSSPTPQPVPGTLSSLTLDRGNRTPYIQQWNFDIEQELGKNWVLELGYLGSKGTKLATRNQIGQGDLLVPGPNAVIVYPYYNFSYILADRTEGSSNYNALIARVEKRFSNGFYLLTHYTWSKSLGISSAACSVGNDSCLGRQNVWDLRADYGPNSYDVTHRFLASFIWELPIGRGKLIGNSLPAFVNTLIGGWQMNGIYQVQSGFPFSVYAVDNSGTNGSAFPRADLVGNPNTPDPVDSTRAFNRYAFAQPSIGAFGNSGRNILRGKGLNNLDFSLFKNTHISERLNLQLRAEFFNFLNHTQLGPFPGDQFSLDPSSQFGVYLSTQENARVVQLAAKFIF